MPTSRRERRQQAVEDWRGRRGVRQEDRATRQDARQADREARAGLEGKEKRQMRRSQRTTRRGSAREMREARGETRREQRVGRKLGFKPERAGEICSPEGAKKRETFNAVVRHPAWLGAAQYLNTSAKVLWAAPEPTMISKVIAGISDGIGYSMKGAAIAGPSVNNIRENLACAMVAELQAAGAIPPELAEEIEKGATDLVESQWDEIPSSNGRPSAFDETGADEETAKVQLTKFLPLGVIALILLFRS